MKYLFIALTIMTTTVNQAQNGKATTIKQTFNRETTVCITIKSDAAIIWTLLTNSSDYPRWNSTVISLKGEIALGEKIELKSILDENRTFNLKIKELIPEQKMVWGDGKGNRVYELDKTTNGEVTFTMTEKIGGLMFPMYAKYIPSFDESFEQFASDLKNEAEIINKTK